MSLAAALFPAGVPDDLRAWGLVMPAEAAAALVAAQDAAGFRRHRVEPVPLTDGRCALCADVLTEAHPGGLFPAVRLVDAAALATVAVLPWRDVLALMPDASGTPGP